jgi:hypothetical protein
MEAQTSGFGSAPGRSPRAAGSGDEGDDDHRGAVLELPHPMGGTAVRFRPTLPPTKALIRTCSENCRQFARRPRRIPREIEYREPAGKIVSLLTSTRDQPSFLTLRL